MMGASKEKGVPNERLAMELVFESLYGLNEGIRPTDSIGFADFGLLAGLPFIPSLSAQYRFIQAVPYNESLSFQVALCDRLVKLEQVNPGNPINIDGHNIKTYSRKEMKYSYLTKEGRYGKATRTFYTQDQKSKKPLIAMATYSGTAVSQVTRRITGLTQKGLGQDFILVADKEWYCGQLINELHKDCGISILTPVKHTKNRMVEFEAVPLEQYEKTVVGNIAMLYTTMKNFEGPLRMILKKYANGKYFALITPECEMKADMAMPIYTKRWRIEDFFGQNTFLGIDKLPSMNLNAKQTILSLRLLAYHVMDNFRHDLGPLYRNMTPKQIYRRFVKGVQGKVQLRGDVIEVSTYGFEHQAATENILSNLDIKLERAGVDPHIPWLGNRRIQFKFH